MMAAVAPMLWILAAFGLTALLVRLLNPVAWRLGLVDHPKGRKDHTRTTPVTGGIAMLMAALVCGAFMFDSFGRATLGFALAAVIVVVMGALDDRYDLPWWSRMLVQIAAALVVVYVAGVRIERLGGMFGPEISTLGGWSVPFTVFAIVGAINAVNMTDGADGQAGLLVLSCLVLIGVEALYVGNAAVAARVPILIGVVAGFLVYNIRWPGWKGARVFMGNSGSALLGLVIACLIARLTQDPEHSIDPVMALWLLPVPLVDCLVLMLRRARHGRSPFAADHNHVHYLMRDAGFGPTRAALLLVAISVLCWLAVTLALHLGAPHTTMFIAFAALCFFWYWATSQRARATGAFRVLLRLSGGRGASATPRPGHARTEAP